MWLLVLLTILAFANCCHCENCPANCTCENRTQGELRIDCRNRTDVDSRLIYNELESFLTGKIEDKLHLLLVTRSFLADVPQAVCNMTSLTHLYFNDNHLKRLPDDCFVRMTHLQVLQSAYNQLEELQDGLFDGLQHLSELALHTNHIASIGTLLFSNLSDLVRLRNVQLFKNRLRSVGPWILSRGLLGSDESPMMISLASNDISFPNNPLNWTFTCGMKLYLDLDVSDNKIAHIADFAAPFGIRNIEYVCLKNLQQAADGYAYAKASFRFSRNAFSCDCIDFVLYRLDSIAQFAHVFSNQYCTSPSRLRNTEIPRIPLREFVCDVTDRCPPGCQCFYRPYDVSMNVNCTSANMTSLPEQLPERPKSYVKYRFVFAYNSFADKLVSRDYFNVTDEFDASCSGVSEISEEFWTQIVRIPIVSFRDNKLTSLPESVANVSISSKPLDISNNPWVCSCESRWMTPWLNSIRDQLSPSKIIQCASPTRLFGRNMLTMTDSEYCYVPPTDLRPIIITISTVSGCLALILVVCLTVYRLRLMLFTRWKLHPFDRDECVGEEMDYDVFLCCSSEDNVRAQRILEMLEGNKYRVCYHLRDFMGGNLIQENIIAAVQRSKRTVCLVTDNFIRSTYSMHEFVVALNHNVNIKHRRLIVLMTFDNVDMMIAGDDADSDGNIELLRQYLRQYTYIDYPKGNWFEKLCYALPLNGMNINRDGTDDEQLLE